MSVLLPQQKDWKHSKLIAQGAEGRVYLVDGAELEQEGQFLNSKKFIFKHRLSKAYRHPELDKSILSARLAAESRNILRALESNVDVPYVWRVESDGIWLEYIEGTALRVLFDDTSNRAKHIELCKEIGRQIARLHSKDLIHGDLTTSNMMLRFTDDKLERLRQSAPKEGEETTQMMQLENDNQQADPMTDSEPTRGASQQQNALSQPIMSTNVNDYLWNPVFIDFGLSYVSTHAEDKAVDLYVLERAILSTHTQARDLFKAIIDGYAECGDGVVLQTFEKVRMRGRKRDMIG